MGTEVLRPRDCLIERIGVTPAVFQHHRRKNFPAIHGNGNPNSNPRVGGRKQVVRPEQKKRFENNGRCQSEPLPSRRSASLDDLRKSNNNHHHNNLVMGQVTILRRGESLDSKINGGDNHRRNFTAKKTGTSDDLVLCGTERLGPAPEMVPKQIRLGELKSVLLSPVAVSGTGKNSDVYAGSAFSMSPSPKSLPLPSFFSKKSASKVVDGDSAARDLRRLLRLD